MITFGLKLSQSRFGTLSKRYNFKKANYEGINCDLRESLRGLVELARAGGGIDVENLARGRLWSLFRGHVRKTFLLVGGKEKWCLGGLLS